MSVHTVTFTKVPNEEQDDLEYTIDSCPGGDCVVWWECKECHERKPSEIEDDEGEYTAHGERHQRIDDVWMTEGKGCAIATTDSGTEGMCEIAETAGLGTHQIDCSYWGDGHWDVDIIKPKEDQK